MERQRNSLPHQQGSSSQKVPEINFCAPAQLRGTARLDQILPQISQPIMCSTIFSPALFDNANKETEISPKLSFEEEEWNQK